MDDEGALYGLMWNNPAFVIGVVFTDRSGFIFRQGWEILWKTIVRVDNLDVRLNSDLVKVTRRGGRVFLDLAEESGAITTTVCDFLVWTAPMSELLTTVSDPTYAEKKLFSGLTPQERWLELDVEILPL